MHLYFLQHCLPCGVVSWTLGTYLGTIAFAYLSFVMFILFFLGLVMFQSAVNEELGLRKCTGTCQTAALWWDVVRTGCAQQLAVSASSSVSLRGMCRAYWDVLGLEACRRAASCKQCDIGMHGCLC